LINPNSPYRERVTTETQEAARLLQQRLIIVSADAEEEFEGAFSRLEEQGAGALVVAADPLFTIGREQVAALAARHRLPAMYQFREFADAGGLMSYGTSLSNAYRQAALYAARILNGAKPSELPVQQPTTFELVINLKTAKTLGLA